MCQSFPGDTTSVSPAMRLIQRLDEYATELEEGCSPFPILAITMMLQCDRTARPDTRQLSVVDDSLSVERNCQAVAPCDYVEGIPPASRPVRFDLRCHLLQTGSGKFLQRQISLSSSHTVR